MTASEDGTAPRLRKDAGRRRPHLVDSLKLSDFMEHWLRQVRLDDEQWGKSRACGADTHVLGGTVHIQLYGPVDGEWCGESQS